MVRAGWRAPSLPHWWRENLCHLVRCWFISMNTTWVCFPHVIMCLNPCLRDSRDHLSWTHLCLYVLTPLINRLASGVFGSTLYFILTQKNPQNASVFSPSPHLGTVTTFVQFDWLWTSSFPKDGCIIYLGVLIYVAILPSTLPPPVWVWLYEIQLYSREINNFSSLWLVL